MRRPQALFQLYWVFGKPTSCCERNSGGEDDFVNIREGMVVMRTSYKGVEAGVQDTEEKEVNKRSFNMDKFVYIVTGS